jgi:hypothetical protein
MKKFGWTSCTASTAVEEKMKQNPTASEQRSTTQKLGRRQQSNGEAESHCFRTTHSPIADIY